MSFATVFRHFQSIQVQFARKSKLSVLTTNMMLIVKSMYLIHLMPTLRLLECVVVAILRAGCVSLITALQI